MESDLLPDLQTEEMCDDKVQNLLLQEGIEV